MKIKDRILLGTVTGLIASIPGRILNSLEFYLGYTDLKYEQSAASLFVQSNKLNTMVGKTIGTIANGTLTATVGISTVYVLSATGRDHAIIKGVGLNMLYWMAFEGLSMKLGISTPYKKPLSPLLSIIDHMVFGASCGYIVSKIGDDSLFPDSLNNKELP